MYYKVKESVNFIKEVSNRKPKIAIILGSGLNGLVDKMEDLLEIEYKNIPNFPISTVKGHKGLLIFGKLNGVEVLVMSGRFHYYEGYSMKDVTYPIYVMKLLGIEKIVVTNAAGGINRNFEPGDLMIIDDFINRFGTNPLIGKNDERFGPRFPDMSEPYKREFIEKAIVSAKNINLNVKKGVYLGVTGPYYETKSEIGVYSKEGADAVGMSTVPETIVANYLGVEILGISVITNMATGIREKKHSHDEVVEIANRASENLSRWVMDIVVNI